MPFLFDKIHTFLLPKTYRCPREVVVVADRGPHGVVGEHFLREEDCFPAGPVDVERLLLGQQGGRVQAGVRRGMQHKHLVQQRERHDEEQRTFPGKYSFDFYGLFIVQFIIRRFVLSLINRFSLLGLFAYYDTDIVRSKAGASGIFQDRRGRPQRRRKFL